MIVIASRERGACPTFQLEVLNTKSAEEDHEGAEEANSLLLLQPARRRVCTVDTPSTIACSEMR
jgi:hypothetical protein